MNELVRWLRLAHHSIVLRAREIATRHSNASVFLDQRDELLGWVTKARARHRPVRSTAGGNLFCAECRWAHPCPTARDLGVTK